MRNLLSRCSVLGPVLPPSLALLDCHFVPAPQKSVNRQLPAYYYSGQLGSLNHWYVIMLCMGCVNELTPSCGLHEQQLVFAGVLPSLNVLITTTSTRHDHIPTAQTCTVILGLVAKTLGFRHSAYQSFGP